MEATATKEKPSSEKHSSRPELALWDRLKPPRPLTPEAINSNNRIFHTEPTEGTTRFRSRQARVATTCATSTIAIPQCSLTLTTTITTSSTTTASKQTLQASHPLRKTFLTRLSSKYLHTSCSKSMELTLEVKEVSSTKQESLRVEQSPPRTEAATRAIRMPRSSPLRSARLPLKF